MTPKGRLEPKEISKISPEVFKKIVNICPGTIVEGLPKEEQGAHYRAITRLPRLSILRKMLYQKERRKTNIHSITVWQVW